MSANTLDYEKMFGLIGNGLTMAAKCACVACNSCTCACSCRKKPDCIDSIEW